MILTGKFYLKNGLVIEDKITFLDNTSEEEYKDIVAQIYDKIQNAIMNGQEFHFTFGHTIIRGSEIAAVTFIE